MPFASSRGYGSLKLQHDLAEAIKHRQAEHNQLPIIYFVSDLDPSGLDLQRAWEQAISDFGVSCVFIRVALTREQIQREVDASGRPLEQLSIAVKPSDRRSKRYIEEDGRECWEVDILPPAVIERDLAIYIESWIDQRAWQRREVEVERARGLL